MASKRRNGILLFCFCCQLSHQLRLMPVQVCRGLTALLISVFVISPTAPAQDRSVMGQSEGIELLKQIEDRVLPLPLVDGAPRNESLRDYYWDANIELRYQLNEAVRAFTTRRPNPFRAFTLVAGPAGIGKTFVKGGVYTNWIPKSEVAKFDIRELLEEFATQGLAEKKPDIEYRGQVISRLLSMTREGRKEFIRLIREQAPSFLVVDSLDEIHPDDYFFVLEELERFSLHGDRDFVHVVLFGRPLVFRDYWRDRRSKGLPNGLRGFVLHPPEFRTTGDLRVSTWNYYCFKYKLSRLGFDGETRSMTFPDFEQWNALDFPTAEDFADVSFLENRCICPEVRDELESWASQHRVVSAVLYNLAGNSIVRDLVEEHIEDNRTFNERTFMDEFFARWLERDSKSGDRPSRSHGTEQLVVYQKLLEAVAAKYLDEHRVNRLGYFDVVDDDRVVVEHEGQTISVPVPRLLNRSGLVTLDPVLPVAQRYRFEPFWIHRHLLYQHLERQMSMSPTAIPAVENELVK